MRDIVVFLLVFGGLPYVLWGIFLRTTLGLHATWLVNSATHMWGSRRFETRDDSRNSWWVALLTFGEGWHNNHHAHPVSARHGLAWWEFDTHTAVESARYAMLAIEEGAIGEFQQGHLAIRILREIGLGARAAVLRTHLDVLEAPAELGHQPGHVLSRRRARASRPG